MALRRAIALSAVALVAACGGSSVRWSPSWTAPGARFAVEQREAFADARERLDAGDRLAALDALRDLHAADPDNLEVGAWLQDLELELLRDGVDLFAPAQSLANLAPDEALRRAYRTRAEALLTFSAFVLAARVETDVKSAEITIERALELDPTNAWAHYARAHVLLEDRERVDRWSLARTALERALSLDPGHIRARRLEAWMAAQEGRRGPAESLLARWLDTTDGDPRVSRRARVDALLDFTLLLLIRGQDRRAVRILEDLEGEAISRPRRLMLLAVGRQEAGDALGALDAALAAQGASRETTLPLVQEALLHELFLDAPDVAEERWRAIAERTEASAGIADLIQGLRARVRLERRAAEAEGAR